MKRFRRIVLLVVLILLVFLVVTIIKINLGSKNIDESIIDGARNTVIEESKLKFTKDDEKSFVGKWNNIKAISKDSKEETNLGYIFGSSVGEYGSYFILKEDSTFEEYIMPITDGSKSSNGTFALRENDKGNYQIYLEYYDGRIEKLDIEKNNDQYTLVLNSNDYDYVFYFHR